MSCATVTCLAGSAVRSSLICVGGEIISAITAVSAGAGAVACNATADAFASGCDGAALRAAVEGACLPKKETCSLDVPTLLADAGCAGGSTLSVNFVCADGGMDTLAVITLLVVCFIALATGTTVTTTGLRAVWREKKRAFLIGFSSQFGFMPLMAFAFAKWLSFDTMTAVGVVLIGAAPGGRCQPMRIERRARPAGGNAASPRHPL